MRCAPTGFALASLLLGAGCAPVSPTAADAAVADAGSTSMNGAFAPPGSAPGFLIDQMSLPPPGVGIDVDGDGSVDGHLNESWRDMFSFMERLIQGHINSGRFLTVLEVAGIDEPYAGADEAVTLKYYRCDDADADPTNNLCAGPGCGQVVADPEYLTDGQTVFRSQPEPIVDYFVTAQLNGVLEVDIGSDQLLRLRMLHFAVTVPAALDVLEQGLFCGVSTARDADAMGMCLLLPEVCIPYNLPEDLSVAALLAVQNVAPDIDMDHDGLETYGIDADGHVNVCYDGDGTEIPGIGCLRDPRMADGFSLCFAFHANRAEMLVP